MIELKKEDYISFKFGQNEVTGFFSHYDKDGNIVLLLSSMRYENQTFDKKFISNVELIRRYADEDDFDCKDLINEARNERRKYLLKEIDDVRDRNLRIIEDLPNWIPTIQMVLDEYHKDDDEY